MKRICIFIFMLGCMLSLGGCISYYANMHIRSIEKKCADEYAGAIVNHVDDILLNRGYRKTSADRIARLKEYIDTDIIAEWSLWEDGGFWMKGYDEGITMRLHGKDNAISIRIVPGPYEYGRRARVEKTQQVLSAGLMEKFPDLRITVSIRMFVNFPPP